MLQYHHYDVCGKYLHIAQSAGHTQYHEFAFCEKYNTGGCHNEHLDDQTQTECLILHILQQFYCCTPLTIHSYCLA